MPQEASKIPEDASKRPRTAYGIPPIHPKIEFSSQLGSHELQKILKVYEEDNGFQFLTNFNKTLMDYQALIASVGRGRLQDASKEHKATPNIYAQYASRVAQGAPKTLQEPPKRRSRGWTEASWNQEPPKSRPRGAQAPTRPRCCTSLETSWAAALVPTYYF